MQGEREIKGQENDRERPRRIQRPGEGRTEIKREMETQGWKEQNKK